jgi:protein-tyrosine phosphatase
MAKRLRRRQRITTHVSRVNNKTIRVVRVDGVARSVRIVEVRKVFMDCSRLPDGIYQGARPTQAPFFADAVINLEVDFYDRFPSSQLRGYLWVPIEDTAEGAPSVEWLDNVVDVMIGWHKLGWQILIHCTAGISRSGLISVAYFMKTRNMSRDAALHLVRTYRQQTHPNAGFLELLRQYERHLTKG